MKNLQYIIFLLASLYMFIGCTSDNARYIDKSVRLEITPSSLEVPVGTEGNFKAFAYDKLNEDGIDVTDEVTWISSDKTVGDFNSSIANHAKALSVGTTTVTATLNGNTSNEVQVSVTNETLSSIVLTPTKLNLPVGVRYKYKAVGIYSDDSKHDLTPFATFNSSDASKATITSLGVKGGLVTAKATGTTVITATYDAKTSNSADLNITAATISSLQITPAEITVPKGTQDRYTAIAYYTDGTGHDVTADANWTSADSSIVSIVKNGTNGGQATAQSVGSTTITAVYDANTSNVAKVTITAASLVSLQIIPQDEKTIHAGLNYQYKAIGTYSDASTKDLTEYALWSSSDAKVADIVSSGIKGGFAHGVSVGTTIITADVDGKYDAVNLHVSDAIVNTITITPEDVNISAGASLQYLAIASYSDASSKDITSVATWSSADETKATIDSLGSNGGLAVGKSAGNTIIRAIYDAKISNDANLTVTGSLIDNIQITPKNITKTLGETQEYTVNAIYVDLSLKDITADSTIKSSDTSKVTIEDGNIAHTYAETGLSSNTFISAVYNLDPSFTTKTAIHVVAPTVNSLEIFPKDTNVTVGASGVFRAVVKLSDGTTKDVTDSATWVSSNTTAVSISSLGLGKALSAGDSNVTASYDSTTSVPSLISVSSSKTISNVQITPNNMSINVGETLAYTVSVIYDDLSVEDVTEFAPIEVKSSIGGGSITIKDGYLITGVKEGGIELTATYNGVVSEREFVYVVTP